MKRSRLSRSVKSYDHHLRFRTKLRHALHHISRETGEPVHKLEANVLAEYEKLPWQKRYAFRNAVVLGGLSSAILAVGAFFPVVLPLASMPFGVEAGAEAAEAVHRRFEKKKLEELR